MGLSLGEAGSTQVQWMVVWIWLAASEWQDRQALVTSGPEENGCFRASCLEWSVVIQRLAPLVACCAISRPGACSLSAGPGFANTGWTAKTSTHRARRMEPAICIRFIKPSNDMNLYLLSNAGR